MTRHKAKRFAAGCMTWMLLIVFLLFFLSPILWMVICSFQPQENLMKKDFEFSSDNIMVNYKALFSDPAFLKALKNSFLISVGATILTIVIAGIAAYIFSRFRFRGKNIIIFSVYSIQMGPAVAFLIPLFLIFRFIHLLDTVTGMILAITTFTIPMSMWIMIGFLQSIPKEMEESAYIDGCTRLKTFWKVIVPLAKPGMISSIIVTFISVWGELLLALPLTLSRATPLTVYASSFSGVYATNFGGAAAVSAISILPVILIVIGFKNYLLNGLVDGAVKG